MSDLFVDAATPASLEAATYTPQSFLKNSKLPAPQPANNSSLDFQTYQAQRYLPALDGLRGVAVALVITCHLHKRIWGFLAGHVGVTVFFVLSGYLITRLALQEERATGTLNLKAFYIRRTFRIFPLYYLVLAIYAALILGTRFVPAKSATFPVLLPYFLTYSQELPVWHLVHLPAGDMPFYHSWSLAIEEKFYLVWPGLMVAIGALRRSWRLPIVLLLAAACIAHSILAAGRHVYNLEHYGCIFFGVALAFMLASPVSYRRTAAWTRKLAPAALLLALATQFVVIPRAPFQGVVALYGLAFTVLLSSILTAPGRAARALSTPKLIFLGRISYGVYLIHILCLSVVEHFLRPERNALTGVLAYIATLSLSMAVAYLLHIGFEQPLIQLGRRLTHKTKAEKPVLAQTQTA